MAMILLTGTAGFIGYFTAKKLLADGYTVCGVDNLNNYYDVRLKKIRLKELQQNKNFFFYPIDIENFSALSRVFQVMNPQAVINLAARAGVRSSILDPHIYLRTNTLGTLNLLELMREYNLKKMVLASTSSLYAGCGMPFKENSFVKPISPYAASKLAAENMAYTYHYLYGMDITVVRYFTVFGPAGRPDMSIFRFIEWMKNDRELLVYGNGKQSRDFTCVGDIARGTVLALDLPGFEIINLGGNEPCTLKFIIEEIARRLGKEPKIRYLPAPKVDMTATWADTTKAEELLGWVPRISLDRGLDLTIDWHLGGDYERFIDSNPIA